MDCEARETVQGARRTQRWRLAVTCFDRSDTDDHSERPPEWNNWLDPDEMWRYIDAKTRRKCRTVVVAHNIGYDLRISRALFILPKLGWKVDRMMIGGRTLSITFRRDNRTLVMCDSMSYFPVGLATVGTMVGQDKLALPKWDDSDDAWFTRCRRDVEIMRTAYRQVLAWLENTNLGNWQRTGAGMAWANWRHCHYTHKVLVHSEPEATKAEVAAIGTGRCEAWRHGTFRAGEFTEWDLPLAYPRIAADTRVPTALMSRRWKPTLKWLDTKPATVRALVRATVTTQVPVVPVKGPDGWLWPVGTFDGWWWDSELALATAHGTAVVPHEAWVYRGYYALRAWAEWVIPAVETPQLPYSPLQRVVAKHWARALIGRFGAKYPVWDDWGEAPEPGVALDHLWTTETQRAGKMLTLGNRNYLGMDTSYVADACPAVMGSIMAECRVRLWHLLEVAGFDHVVYMDTDSLITDKVGSANLRRWLKDGNGWGLRTKAKWRTLEVMGPRQLIIDGRGRVAGVPTDAHRVGKTTWQGEVWDSVATSIAQRGNGTVTIRERQWNVKGTDNRRLHLPTGRTAPVELRQPLAS